MKQPCSSSRPFLFLIPRNFAMMFFYFLYSEYNLRILFSLALHIPLSVISPVIYFAGVTSNPKFIAGLPYGVTSTLSTTPWCNPSI